MTIGVAEQPRETKPLSAWPDREGFYSRDAVLGRIEAHRRADEIVQRIGWDEDKNRGCAIGCAIHDYSHDKVAERLDITEELTRLIDRIHEGLPWEDSLGWPGRIFGAIAQDADTSDVCRQFKILLQRRNLARVTGEGKVFDQVRQAIRGVIAWLESGCSQEMRETVWSAARSVARSVARSAAWSARSAAWSARSVAWSAARSAAESAESARSVAWSAACSAAESARSAEWLKQASDLIALCQKAPKGV